MTDPVPPWVAGYDVTGMLGAGSGGEVWLGRDRGTGEQVALKRVRPGAGLVGRDRLRREAAALAGLTHPHVLRLRSVVGCLDTPDDLVLVLDAALGGSLARLFARQGPRPAGQVATVLVAVAEALAAVHRAGLAHGDVTPSNVLVTADGRPVLGDLGSARLGAGPPRAGGAPLLPDGHGPGGEPVGTPGYADPAGADGPAADVHGLAATCFFLLTGRPPYDVSGARVPADGGFSVAGDLATRRLMTVLDTALHPDPGHRPDAAALGRAAFDAALPEPLTVDLLDVAAGGAGGAADEGTGETAAGTTWGVPITQRSPSRWTSGPGRSEHASDRVAPLAEASGRRRGAHARPRPARTRGSPWAALRRTRTSGSPRPGGSWAAGSRSVGWWSALGRRGVAALGTAVAVVLAAVTGIAWAGAGPVASPGRHAASGAALPSSATGSSGPVGPVPGSTSRGRPSTETAARLTPEHTWSVRLRTLDRARAAAFAAGDSDALDRVYAAGSPALRRDRRAVRHLVAEGLVADGVRLRAVDVRVVSSADDEVRLAVTDELAAYRLLDARTGEVVERRPGRGRASWLLTLRRLPDGWRVWDVARR